MTRSAYPRHNSLGILGSKSIVKGIRTFEKTLQKNSELRPSCVDQDEVVALILFIQTLALYKSLTYLLTYLLRFQALVLTSVNTRA